MTSNHFGHLFPFLIKVIVMIQSILYKFDASPIALEAKRI